MYLSFPSGYSHCYTLCTSPFRLATAIATRYVPVLSVWLQPLLHDMYSPFRLATAIATRYVPVLSVWLQPLLHDMYQSFPSGYSHCYKQYDLLTGDGFYRLAV